MRSTRTLAALTLTTLLAAAAACSSNGNAANTTTAAAGGTSTVAAPSTTTAPTTTTVAPTTTAPPTTAAPAKRFYLSVGDSYASGYQPGVGNTTDGFAYQVTAASQTSTHPLELFNVGCAGATTTSLLNTKGCEAARLGPGATPYDNQTQIEAAETFLKAHPGEVALITVSIGGNDATACAKDANVAGCVGAAVETIKANLPVIVQRLRAAAGTGSLIVGTTYPDVFLGDWLTGPAGQQLATLSVTAFQALINPALSAAYSSVQGQFADVTAATGAYTPLTQLTTLAPYGSIPVAVAKVCELTHYCAQQDIHPNQAGYKVIADLVYADYVKAQPAG